MQLTAYRSRRLLTVLGASAMLAVAGCGSDDDTKADSGDAAEATITAPAAIKSAGKITFCSDIAYPPMEFYEGDDPEGLDIEIAEELAERMGVEATFQNTGFDGIIAALQAKKCDAIISSLTNSPERAKEIDFVDYAQFGLAVLVKNGNTEISSIEDLGGKTVAVQVGTTTKQVLEAESDKIEKAGGQAVKVTTFPKDTDAANALRTGKVDAYLTDAPPAAYFVKQAPKDFALAATPQIDTAPVGIGVRKDNAELSKALQEGIDAMTADGELLELLTEWELADAKL